VPVRDYRDLLVWQRAMELNRVAYAIAGRLPMEERFALSAQIRRSASSVSANIVEGHSRRRRAEFLHFLSISYASLKELESHVLTALAVGYIEHDAASTLLLVSGEVSRMLVALRRSLGDPLNAKR
jgi:four helix bundle protein